MATRGIGAIRRAWYNWQMQRFPWRKKWLIGFDLQGNTFWEFKDVLHALRNRRVAKYSRSTHYGDVNVSPSWMQWLRYTREDPPTLLEQQRDVMRQERMKMLAAQADAKWAEKPSALDGPDRMQSRDQDSGVSQMNVQQEKRERPESRRVTLEAEESESQIPVQESEHQRQQSSPTIPDNDAPRLATRRRMWKEPKDSPWTQAAGNPGEDWQPQAWSPAPAKRRA